MADFDGIYAGYFTGTVSSSFGLFLFGDGRITGADAGGAVYLGSYRVDATKRIVEGEVTLSAPPHTPLITGAVSGDAPIDLRIPIKLPDVINEAEVYRIETPVGPVNARFRKLRSLV